MAQRTANTDTTTLADQYVLYGLPISYFTEKCRHAMTWYVRDGFRVELKSAGGALGGDADEYNEPTPTQTIEMRAATHQIPVVRTPENWMLADSTPILQLLDSRLGSTTRRFYPAGLNGALAAVLEEYFDEWFARLAVFTRWSFFEENASSEDWPLRQVPAVAAAWGKRAVRATLGGTELQQEHGVKELQRVLGALNDHLEQQRRGGGSGRFIFGDTPTAADAVIYGGCTAHFLFDPAPIRMLRGRVDTLQAAVDGAAAPVPPRAFPLSASAGGHSHPSRPEVPEFVHLVLTEMAQNGCASFARANAAALAQGRKGAVSIDYHGTSCSYLCRPYPEKSRQLLRRFLATHLAVACTAAERATFRELMEEKGLFDLYHPEGVDPSLQHSSASKL